MVLVNSFNIFQLSFSAVELIFNLLKAANINLIEIEIYYFQDEIKKNDYYHIDKPRLNPLLSYQIKERNQPSCSEEAYLSANCMVL